MQIDPQSQLKGAFVLDVDDPFVYSIIRNELTHYTTSWNLIEPNMETAQRATDLEYILDPALPKHEINTYKGYDITYDDDNGYAMSDKCINTVFWAEYERINWDSIDYNPEHSSTIWYTNRKGLIRKGELAQTIERHLTKCPYVGKQDHICEIIDDENVPLYLCHDNCGDEVDTVKTDIVDDQEEGIDTTNTDDTTDDHDTDNDTDDDDDDHDDDVDDDHDDDDTDDDDDDNNNDNDEPSSQLPPYIFKKHHNCCPLQQHVPETYTFTLYNTDSIDELLICDLPEIGALDTYTPNENFARGDVWILKPSLTNQAREIHIIASTESFRTALTTDEAKDIREWVIQRYVHPPLLLNGRKFHIRAHVVALGGITVYLVDRLLALFSLRSYNNDNNNDNDNDNEYIDPSVHITNVCYQKRNFMPHGQIEHFREDLSVLLLHEAAQSWAMEYITIALIGHTIPSSSSLTWDNINDALYMTWGWSNTNDSDNNIINNSTTTTTTSPQYLCDGRHLFLFYLHRVMISIIDKTMICSINDLSRLIALEFYSHISTQITTILQETYIASLGLSSLYTSQFVPPIELTPYTITPDQHLRSLLLPSVSSSSSSSSQYRPTTDMLSHARSGQFNAKYKPLDNCMELYGFDFMVDGRGKVLLIEANAGPDFGQTGHRLKKLVCEPLVRGMVSLLLQNQYPTLSCRDKPLELKLKTKMASFATQQLSCQDFSEQKATIETGGIINNIIVPEENGIGDNTTTDKVTPEVTYMTDYLGYNTPNVWDLPSAPHFIPLLHLPL